MSSTLLFCDHTCYGQRTLYDCCHIGTIAAMLLENRFVRRHLYALLVESYKDCPSRALLGVSRGRAHIFPCSTRNLVSWLVSTTSDSFRPQS